MLQQPRDTVMEAKRILVVDDDDDFAASLGDLLHLRGYEIATAACPDEAMRTLAAVNPQVVTIDIRLGNFSGVDLLSQLMSKRPDLICVMITTPVESRLPWYDCTMFARRHQNLLFRAGSAKP